MPTQTPGPRRFAPPASSSSVRSAALAGASGRFARPSQPTSSPFTRTPFSSTTRKDEIEIDDDEDEDEDNLDEIPRLPAHQYAPARFSQRPATARSNLSARKPATQPQHDDPHIQSADKSGSSLKGSKRRKISHFHPETFDDQSDLLDSSPPASSPTKDYEPFNQESELAVARSRQSSPANDNASTKMYERPATARDSSPVLTDEESPGKEFATPKMRTSRFRNPMTQSSQAATTTRQSTSKTAEQPLPSFQSRLLAANTASSPGSHLRGPQPFLEYVLPDAFSPSRRRGQFEYIEHGHAEVVRGWVLDIAARSGINDMPSMSRQQLSNVDSNTFSITGIVHRDADDRFAIVSTADEEYNWMLVDTDSKPQAMAGITPKSRIERLREGSRFVLKGGQVSHWMLNSTEESTSHEMPGTKDLESIAYRVVVLWDLIH